MSGRSRTLVVSLLTNVVLAGAVVYLLRDRTEEHRRSIVSTPASPPALEGANAAENANRRDESPRTESMSFRWAQIESSDYRTYIGNLSRIGCPEQTVRDIITADVHALYAPRLARLEERRGNSSKPPVGSYVATRAAAEAELNSLRSEEASVLARLFGTESISGPASNGIAKSEEAPAELPLVFQQVDSTRFALDETQIETLNELRQRFRDAIGGPNQDPNAPVYRERWQIAQRENDELLSGLLGGEFFEDYQQAASNPQPSN